ncbi:Zinc finger BED domain-containing protein RICESLEEPER 2 [Bienertia sinuspersici]
MADEMLSKYNNYWFNSEEDNYGMLFSFALILDPRCKLSLLSFCYEHLCGNEVAALKITEAQYKLSKFYKEYTPESHVHQHTSPASSIGVNMQNTLSRTKQYDKQELMANSIGRSQLEVYLEDPKLNRTAELDILNFWKENEHRYGALSHLARDILTVPLTTFASESTFGMEVEF